LTLVLNNLKKLINKNNFYLLLIIISSVFFTSYTGFKGIFPIDSFLIFDAGFKIINNYHPFRDYWSITGPFLDYVQFIFFKILGVNWTAYVLHAAVINVVLSLVTFYFFCQIGLKRNFAFIYAFSISILGYPSVGTPFMDHHASILSLIALMALILGIKKNSNIYWFSIPILLGFSFFSKQIPSAYLGFLFLVIIFTFLIVKKFKKTQFLNFLFYGLTTFIIICFLIVSLNNISLKNIFIQYVLYPINIGEERSANINFDLEKVLLQFKFIYFSLIILIVPGFYLVRLKKKKFKNLIDVIILFSFLFSVFIFIYSQLMTKNQILIFFLIPFCIGMTHYYLDNYYKNEKFIYILIFIIIISTVKFHIRFNIEKKFMELSTVNFKLAEEGRFLHPKLKGLDWITPNYPNNPRKELLLLKDLSVKIKNEKRNKIIISDYQILPSITDTNNFAPNKWFDDLSVPKSNNKYYKIYKRFFESNLKEKNIQVIFIVGKNKFNYLSNHFLDKNCYTSNEINEIAIRLNIEKCNFEY